MYIVVANALNLIDSTSYGLTRKEIYVYLLL